MRMDFILCVDNIPAAIFCREKDVFAFFKHTSLTENLSTLWELLEQKVILQRDFEALRKNVNVAKETAALASFHWVVDCLRDYLESAKDCIYLRPKTVDLRLFLQTAIERWQRGLDEHEESAADVIREHFPDIEDHGFDLNNIDDPVFLANVVYEEVMDYWGGICWEGAELALNDMNPFYQNEIDLDELMSTICDHCMGKCC